MGVRDRLRAGLARQLGRPEGLGGRLLGRGLDRGNRVAVSGAVAATALEPGQVGADVGFGGGLGLRLLLDQVGPSGRVHGVELSGTMLAAAERRHRSDVAAGRLVLRPGVLQELPLEDDQVDGLITVNTLYFVDDVGAAFAELARVVRPAGRAVVGIGDPDAMAAMPVTRHGFRLRAPEELVDGLRDAGFSVYRARVDRNGFPFHLLVGTTEPG